MITKTCSTCKKDLPIEDFYPRRVPGKNYTNPKCKACQKTYHKAWYGQNKEKVKKNNRENTKLLIERNTEFINSLKAGKPCMDCGGRFPPVCMDFDHRPGTQKVKGISQLRLAAWSREKITEEIAKCDLVCSNCHRIRTHSRRGPTSVGN